MLDKPLLCGLYFDKFEKFRIDNNLKICYNINMNKLDITINK